MAKRNTIVGWLSDAGEYEPGDPPPVGYSAWHEWAGVQHKAGLRQKSCSKCGKWNYPQEIATTTQETQISYRTKRDAARQTNPIETVIDVIVCKDCQQAAMRMGRGPTIGTTASTAEG